MVVSPARYGTPDTPMLRARIPIQLRPDHPFSETLSLRTEIVCNSDSRFRACCNGLDGFPGLFERREFGVRKTYHRLGICTFLQLLPARWSRVADVRDAGDRFS